MQSKGNASQKNSKNSNVKKKLIPYLFILPFIISFVLFFAIPAIYSLRLSFLNYKGYGQAKFVGLGNYSSLLEYSAFWKAVKNTFFYFLTHLVPVMLGAFLIALVMQGKAMMRMQKVFKPVIFLPQIVPVMATALTFRIIFAKNTGAINQILGTNAAWLENPATMRWCVVLMVVWRSIGWFMVIFLAGLTTISKDINEAAIIDGANNVQIVTKITVPLMKPIFLFAFVMDAIGSFKIYTEPNIMIAGTSTLTTDAAPIMNIITTNIRGGNFGMASAAGWLLFLLILIISVMEMLLLRDKGTDKG